MTSYREINAVMFNKSGAKWRILVRKDPVCATNLADKNAIKHALLATTTTKEPQKTYRLIFGLWLLPDLKTSLAQYTPWLATPPRTITQLSWVCPVFTISAFFRLTFHFQGFIPAENPRFVDLDEISKLMASCHLVRALF